MPGSRGMAFKVSIIYNGRIVSFLLGLLPNSTLGMIGGMIEVGCLTPTKEEAVYDRKTPVFS